MNFKKIISFLYSIKKNWFSSYYIKSYSQEGEDMILNKYLENIKDGYYIDIGAHHPKRFSNTYLFYKKGWKGINIDARPGSMKLFDRLRPLDVNLELGLSGVNENLTFYIFNEPALNTFDETLAKERSTNSKYFITESRRVKCLPLNEVLDKYLPIGKIITFLSIDIEGFDLYVLKTNNWELYRPQYIVVESYSILFEDVLNSEIYVFLKEKNYSLVAKSYYSLIFKCSI